MTVLLLIGCAEPGRDGVGDYSRRLAAAMTDRGIRTVIVATHDKFTTALRRENQAAGTQSVPVVRIPQGAEGGQRAALIGAALDRERPDWVSFQYVPYSFQPKGIPLGFLRRLAPLLTSYRTHVMFHECWVGITKASPWKHHLTGFFQRGVVKHFLAAVSPELITTSNELYRAVLGRAGIPAELLPLFSNIEVARQPTAPFAGPHAALLNTPGDQLRDRYLIAGIFGSIYPQLDLGAELPRLLGRARESGRQLLLIAFGRAGADGIARLREAAASADDALLLAVLGELDEAQVSAVLSKLEVALSCTPRQHLGKSGVFAAMRLHGVEVISSVDEPLPEYTELIETATAELYARAPQEWSVAGVADRFLSQLVTEQNQPQP